MQNSLILASDAYKHTHWLQYPKGTEHIYSYFESRGGHWKETMFFGLQMILKKHLVGKVIDFDMIYKADYFMREVFGAKYFNTEGWLQLWHKHEGILPLSIKAVPEGAVVPNHNILMSIENTDPEFPWLTNFVETLLVQTWYPSTVATLGYHIKENIREYAQKTGGSVSPFHLNDFGFRGVSSVESAGIGGCAHLVNFQGTDTLEGIRYAKEYYGAGPCGFSVMASEHSTTTIYGEGGERDAYEYFIDNCPSGILSLVSDSYDIYYAVRDIFGKQLRDKILARDGKLVIRPDSGDPAETTVEVLEILWSAFGGTKNSAGYRVLDPHVGVIYGDGINEQSIDKILRAVMTAGYSVDNVVFGMGGGLLQQVHRDTLKFAFKCSAARVNGEWRDVYKNPVTDPGKKSKRGRMKLIYDGNYHTDAESWPGRDELVEVFRDGKLLVDHTFDDVRARASVGSRQGLRHHYKEGAL